MKDDYMLANLEEQITACLNNPDILMNENQPTNDENLQPIQMGQSLPAAGEMHQGAEPGTQGTDGPVQEDIDLKGQIDHVRPIKGGRRFVLKDGSTACLADDGEIWISLEEENKDRWRPIINRWMKLSGWTPTIKR